jgi:serine/threonine protein kinase
LPGPYSPALPCPQSIDPFGLKAGRVWHSETKLLGDVNQTGQVGSLRYMAPENFKGRPYSYKTDVYSFAILLYELLMREKAYGGLFLNGEQIAELASSARAQRPALPPRWPAEAKELLNACWDADPAKRPEFTAIANQLAKWRADPSDKVLAQIWAASPLPAPERIKAAVSGAATQYAARWSAKPMPPGSVIAA